MTNDYKTWNHPDEPEATMDPQVFYDIELKDLRARAEQYHANGWRFCNICGSTIEAREVTPAKLDKDGNEKTPALEAREPGVELLYSFSNGEQLENLRFTIKNADIAAGTVSVPAVSDLWFNAFVFENETHDLYGVPFKGIAIDFGGNFYKTSVPHPMNPQFSVIQKQDLTDEGKALLDNDNIPHKKGAN
jgi:NADH:ubiquinone oxidoreductase subunit C